MMGMKHRIWLEKTMLLKRIKGQKTDSLSKQILEEQKSNKWPGLSQEVTNICEEINIPDINDCEISAREIKQAVFDHHYAEIKSKISSSKKMMSHKDENFKEVQDYMRGKSVENIRVAFRIRCEMVQEIRGNYKDKYRRKGGEAAVLCPECPAQETETQSHCLVCPRWEDIRRGMDLTKIEDMVVFFQKLLTERMKEKSGSHGAAQVSND